MKKKQLSILVLIFTLVLAACGDGAPTEPAPAEDTPVSVEEEAPEVESESEPAPTEEPEPTAVPESAFEPLPPDGQRVEFTAEDGTALVGYYYPASAPDAPVVVLMHWARGDQTDWQKNGMIDWLQNRAGGGGTQSPSKQSVIYPPMPEGVSFAVFAFDFRGFGESSGSFNQAGGLMDAKAAYEIAKTLGGVDPNSIAGIGSSIGADGVVNGCAEGCLGALSLSPGGYLTVPYPDAVKAVDGKPVTCVASEGDTTSAEACRAAVGAFYLSIIYPGDAHGDQFYQSPPDGFGDMLFDWLKLVFEIDA